MDLNKVFYTYRPYTIVGVLLSSLVLSYILITFNIPTYINIKPPFNIEGGEFGEIGMLMFILTIALAFSNYLFRSGKIKWESLASLYSNKENVIQSLHILFGILTVVFITIHFLSLSPSANLFNLAAYILLIYNAAIGICFKFTENETKIYTYLLHQQWSNVIAIIIFIIIGHAAYGYW